MEFVLEFVASLGWSFQLSSAFLCCSVAACRTTADFPFAATEKSFLQTLHRTLVASPGTLVAQGKTSFHSGRNLALYAFDLFPWVEEQPACLSLPLSSKTSIFCTFFNFQHQTKRLTKPKSNDCFDRCKNNRIILLVVSIELFSTKYKNGNRMGIILKMIEKPRKAWDLEKNIEKDEKKHIWDGILKKHEKAWDLVVLEDTITLPSSASLIPTKSSEKLLSFRNLAKIKNRAQKVISSIKTLSFTDDRPFCNILIEGPSLLFSIAVLTLVF
jgi:hypothetical protein